jgi:hypothetical protein
MRPTRLLLFLAAASTAMIAAGCFKAPASTAGPEQPARHHHNPPHHGTPIALGAGDYHVELVLDASTGTLQAFVLDDEMEEFVRSSAPMITIATTRGDPHEVVLSAVPNPETGETVGDTALFEGHAVWLRSAAEFEGVLKSITIRGTTYTEVKFSFPKGDYPDG